MSEGEQAGAAGRHPFRVNQEPAVRLRRLDDGIEIALAAGVVEPLHEQRANPAQEGFGE